MNRILLSLLPLLAAACGASPTLVVIERLAPGGGEAGNGGFRDYARPQLDILVRMESEATHFNPPDLMRVTVNGVDRTGDLVIGGLYALLRLDPAPVGTPQFVEIATRTGPVADTFTFNAVPFTGPTLAGVSPAQARSGAAVTLTGAGFSGGALRVFFGGVEGTVQGSSDTSITAMVPAGALPGLVLVLVGAESAEGVVGFQPLDGADQPVPFPAEDPQLFAVFPAHGGIETPVSVFGVNFDEDARPEFNARLGVRILGLETVTVPPVGDVLRAFAVIEPTTEAGAGGILVDQDGTESNTLPFRVDG